MKTENKLLAFSTSAIFMLCVQKCSRVYSPSWTFRAIFIYYSLLIFPDMNLSEEVAAGVTSTLLRDQHFAQNEMMALFWAEQKKTL